MFSFIFIFVRLIKMTIYLIMQKNIAQIRVHKPRPIEVIEVFFPLKWVYYQNNEGDLLVIQWRRRLYC